MIFPWFRAPDFHAVRIDAKQIMESPDPAVRIQQDQPAHVGGQLHRLFDRSLGFPVFPHRRTHD
jgi:hypothetical protein